MTVEIKDRGKPGISVVTIDRNGRHRKYDLSPVHGIDNGVTPQDSLTPAVREHIEKNGYEIVPPEKIVKPKLRAKPDRIYHEDEVPLVGTYRAHHLIVAEYVQDTESEKEMVVFDPADESEDSYQPQTAPRKLPDFVVNAVAEQYSVTVVDAAGNVVAD